MSWLVSILCDVFASTINTDNCAYIDLDDNKAISFIEYLCLHYKAMILIEFYKRTETKPTEDLTEDGVGIIGVGEKILDELFYPKVMVAFGATHAQLKAFFGIGRTSSRTH